MIYEVAYITDKMEKGTSVFVHYADTSIENVLRRFIEDYGLKFNYRDINYKIISIKLVIPIIEE